MFKENESFTGTLRISRPALPISRPALPDQRNFGCSLELGLGYDACSDAGCVSPLDMSKVQITEKEEHSHYFNAKVIRSQEDIAEALNTHASLSLSYAMFVGSVKSEFTKTSSPLEIRMLVTSKEYRHTRWADEAALRKGLKDSLDQEQQYWIELLKKDLHSKSVRDYVCHEMWRKYGTHIITRETSGVHQVMSLKLVFSSESAKQAFADELDAELSGIGPLMGSLNRGFQAANAVSKESASVEVSTIGKGLKHVPQLALTYGAESSMTTFKNQLDEFLAYVSIATNTAVCDACSEHGDKMSSQPLVTRGPTVGDPLLFEAIPINFLFKDVYKLLGGAALQLPSTPSIRSVLKVMMQYARLNRVSVDAEALSSGRVPCRSGMPGVLRGELPALLPGPLFVVAQPPTPTSTPRLGEDSQALHMLFANAVLSQWQDVREELTAAIDSLKVEALKMVHVLLDSLASSDPLKSNDQHVPAVDMLLLRIQGLTGYKSLDRFTGFAIYNGKSNTDGSNARLWTPIWAGSLWYDGNETLTWLPESGDGEESEVETQNGGDTLTWLPESGKGEGVEAVTPTRGHKYCGLLNRSGKPDGFGQLVLDIGTDANPVLLEGLFQGTQDGKPSSLLGSATSRVMPFNDKYVGNQNARATRSEVTRLAPYLEPILKDWKIMQAPRIAGELTAQYFHGYFNDKRAWFGTAKAFGKALEVTDTIPPAGSLPKNPEEIFSFRVVGNIRIPITSQYRFTTVSDDASHIYLDGKHILNNGGNHPKRERCSDWIPLTKGQVPTFEVLWGNEEKIFTLKVLWEVRIDGGLHSAPQRSMAKLLV